VNNFWYNAAAWVQAIGTIAAVIGSAWVANAGSRAARRNAEEAKIASKTAALNLAILAHTHIRNLLELLRDEARRGRLNHISPSRSFISQQQMLIRFPIESLEDPDAMVAFAFFPSALLMAADLYTHLEEAVRAVEEENPAEIFDHYAEQMVGLEELLQQHLDELKAALKLKDGIATGHGAQLLRSVRHFSTKRRSARRPQAARPDR
jgi:hypothetical protein